MFFGSVLALLGIVFLLQNLGYISGDVWGIIWPAIMIFAGFSMIMRPKLRGKIFENKNKK
jgi:hypothetical protein